VVVGGEKGVPGGGVLDVLYKQNLRYTQVFEKGSGEEADTFGSSH